MKIRRQRVERHEDRHNRTRGPNVSSSMNLLQSLIRRYLDTIRLRFRPSLFMDLKRFVLNLAINIIAILAAVWLVPGIELNGDWWAPAIVALLFGLINTGVRPLLLLLTLPFVIVTLGFFMLVINAIVL